MGEVRRGAEAGVTRCAQALARTHAHTHKHARRGAAASPNDPWDLRRRRLIVSRGRRSELVEGRDQSGLTGWALGCATRARQSEGLEHGAASSGL